MNKTFGVFAFVIFGLQACAPTSGGTETPSGTGGSSTTTGGRGGSGPRGGSGGGSGGATGGSSASGGTTGGSAVAGSGGAGGTAAGSGGASGGAGGSAGSGSGGSGAMGDAAAPGEGGSTDPQQPAMPAETNLALHKFSKVIKMDTTATGANVTATIAKFPVAVLLNAQNFDFTQAKPNGDDIRFSKMDGTLLPYNVESWDATAKTAAIWVLVDEVKGNDNAQSFVMHWGNPAAGSASNPKAVFPMADGWLGVWHLNEDGSETAGGYRDSSEYEAHGTGVKLAPGSRVDGRIGKATRLQNSRAMYMGQWVRVDGPKVEEMYNAANRNITVSIWANPASFPGHSTIGGYETVFSKGDTSWTLQRFSLNRTWEACTKGPGNVSWHNCAISRSQVATNQWFHFVLVITPSNLTLYINGAREAGTGNGKRTSPHPFGIGQQTQSLMGKREWDGIVDEARVAGVVRDANWVKLEFESQKDGSKFLSYGPVMMK